MPQPGPSIAATLRMTWAVRHTTSASARGSMITATRAAAAAAATPAGGEGGEGAKASVRSSGAVRCSQR